MKTKFWALLVLLLSANVQGAPDLRYPVIYTGNTKLGAASQLQYTGTGVACTGPSNGRVSCAFTVGGGLGNAPFYSPADWAAQVAETGNNSTGNYSTGDMVFVTKAMTFTGIRYYHPTAAVVHAGTKASLWDVDTGTRLAVSATFTPTQAAINTVLFTAPYAYTPNGHSLAFMIYDGSNQIIYSSGNSVSPCLPGILGPSIVLRGIGYSSGDAMAGFTNVTSGANYCALEPTFTIP